MGRLQVVRREIVRVGGPPGPPGPPGNAVAAGIFSPRDYGAHPGNPLLDSGPGVRAAIQAAHDAGGGIVLIDDAYWCSGVVAQLGAVTIIGLGPRRGSTAPPDPDKGLFAFDDTFQFQYGQWGAGSANDNPGPLWNLLISGEDIAGGGTVGVDDLFLMQCVNGSIMDCQVIKSAGVGLQLGASQNTTIRGGYTGLHAGAALDSTAVNRQGAGHVTVYNMYVGSSRKLFHGSGTAGYAQPHDVYLVDPIFENYRLGNDLVHVRSGEYHFVRPVITNSAAGDALVPPFDCVLLIENDIVPVWSTVVTLESPYLASSAALVTDLIRIKNGGAAGQVANRLYVYGRHHWSKGTNRICIDGGGLQSGWVSVEGETYAAAGTGALNPIRVVNGGSLVSYVSERSTPMRFEVPNDATVLPATDWRVAGDTARRMTADPYNRGFFLFDGLDGSQVRGSWYWDAVDDVSVMGRIVRVANGWALRQSETSVTTPGQAITLGASATAAGPSRALAFGANNATAAVTMSGGVTGSQLQVLLDNRGSYTGVGVTWPSDVHDAPQPIAGSIVKFTLAKYSNGEWYAGASLASDVTGPSTSTNNDFAMFNGTTGKVIKDSGLALDTDGTLAADSDEKIPSQKAVKTYIDRPPSTKSPLASWAGKHVLWLGTSIPQQGAPNADSYPHLAVDAVGADVDNQAWAGSHATFVPTDDPFALPTVKALSMTEDDRVALLAIHGPTSAYSDTFDAVTKASQMTADYRIAARYAVEVPEVVVLDHSHNDRHEPAGTLNPPSMAITGITKGATTTVTVASTASIAVGDAVALEVVGVPFLDHAAARVQAKTSTTLTLNVNSAGYTGSLTSGTLYVLDRSTYYGAFDFLIHYVLNLGIRYGVTPKLVLASAPSKYTGGVLDTDIATAATWSANLAAKWGAAYFDVVSAFEMDLAHQSVFFEDTIHPVSYEARQALANVWATWMSGGAARVWYGDEFLPASPIAAGYTEGGIPTYSRFDDGFTTSTTGVGPEVSVLTEDFVSIADWTTGGTPPTVAAAPWNAAESAMLSSSPDGAATSYIVRTGLTLDEGFSCAFDLWLPVVSGLTTSPLPATIQLARFAKTTTNNIWATVELVARTTGCFLRVQYFTNTGGTLQTVPYVEVPLSANTKHRVALEWLRSTPTRSGGVIVTLDGDRINIPAAPNDSAWTGVPDRFTLGVSSINTALAFDAYFGNLVVNKRPVTTTLTTASAVAFTPTGGLAATNVQAALAEVDAEKVAIAALNELIDDRVNDLIAPGSGILKVYDDAGNLLSLISNTSDVHDQLTTGEETFDRQAQSNNVLQQTSQVLKLTYFVARKTEAVTSLVTYCGAVAAGATPTLCRMGLYSVDGSGNLTLIASTPNDTSLWSVINTKYAKNVSVATTKTAGVAYALGVLCVTTATVPQLAGNTPNTAMSAGPPRLSGQVSGQTDLPATVAVGSIANLAQRVYGEILP